MIAFIRPIWVEQNQIGCPAHIATPAAAGGHTYTGYERRKQNNKPKTDSQAAGSTSRYVEEKREYKQIDMSTDGDDDGGVVGSSDDGGRSREKVSDDDDDDDDGGRLVVVGVL